MRHHDMQLVRAPWPHSATWQVLRWPLSEQRAGPQIGGLVLHQGQVAEMQTGEGKTLAATLPAYLNALTGRGVHIVTANAYLAQRDRDWCARLLSRQPRPPGLAALGAGSSGGPACSAWPCVCMTLPQP